MTSVRITLDTMPPGRRLMLYASATIGVLIVLILGCASVLRFSGAGSEGTQHSSGVQDQAAQPPVVAPPQLTSTLTPDQNAAIDSDIASLKATPSVQAGTSRRYPPIGADARSQPDLYARAFVTRLLTRDYRNPRAELLAWVQSETAMSSEPMVVGLVPPNLRPKLGLWSLTYSPDGGAVPIPSAVDWAQWADRHAYMTVAVTRVREPVKWASAVAAGRLTDPGVTARDVDAQVTTHWREGKTMKQSTDSVTVGLDLEGPPSRAGYGFVDVVTYDTVPVTAAPHDGVAVN